MDIVTLFCILLKTSSTLDIVLVSGLSMVSVICGTLDETLPAAFHGCWFDPWCEASPDLTPSKEGESLRFARCDGSDDVVCIGSSGL